MRLKYGLGRSHREIATALGIATSTVSDYTGRPLTRRQRRSGRSPARLGASRAPDRRSRREGRASCSAWAPRRWFRADDRIPASIASVRSPLAGRISSRAALTGASSQAVESNPSLPRRRARQGGCSQSCSPPTAAGGLCEVEPSAPESPPDWTRRSSRRTPARRATSTCSPPQVACCMSAGRSVDVPRRRYPCAYGRHPISIAGGVVS